MVDYGNSPLAREVSALIRARMARLGITQSQLADAVNLSQSQLSKQLRGIRQLNIDELDAICRALGLDITDVFNEAQAAVHEPASNVTAFPTQPLTEAQEKKYAADESEDEGEIFD